MAEIFAREKVLLGYSTSPTELSSPRRRSSDVDFSDVFGGPPRRSSNQDERTSFDSHGFDGDNDAEEDDEGWINKLREKPVFGEAPGVVRRRYTSDDFFDDIFRGEQASSSAQSPRVMARRSSPFSSAPGSRAMSPSRSLPPADPFATPAKFSLPGRVTSTDFMASTSLNQNLFSPSLSRFNQTTQIHDCGNGLSYQSSAVPRPDSTDGKESTSGSLLHGLSDQSAINNYSKGSEFPTFHFSIYNWPSNGVPLVISFRKKSPISKEATKLDRCRSSSEKQVRVDTLLSEYQTVHTLVTDALSLKKSGSPVKDHEQDDSSVSLRTAEAKSKKDDTAPAELNSTCVSSSLNVLDKARERVSSCGLEVAKEANDLSDKGSDSVAHKHNKLPKSLHKKTKSNMRPLSSFFNKNNEGNATVVNRKMGDQMSMRTEKEAASPNDDVSAPKSNKTKVLEKSPASKSDACESEATGKVKDFVKIFTQGLPSKASGPSLRQSHSRRWKDTKNDEVDHEIRFSSARMNDEVEASFVNWEETWPDTSAMDDGNSAGSSQFNMNDIGNAPDTTGQTSAKAPNVDSSSESATNTRAFSADDILVNVEAKGHETKVSQWAKGKEGNIRALLSTLQYVLWPESGWKPIPLVDIIEANAVKRAYQKALLRLHPDKLQQKGAAPDHKLIAEDVFDILQEAWDQFNSLGSL